MAVCATVFVVYTDPKEHNPLDFWALLGMLSVGSQRSKVVLSLLRRKFVEGHATLSWLQNSLAVHEVIHLITVTPSDH